MIGKLLASFVVLLTGIGVLARTVPSTPSGNYPIGWYSETLLPPNKVDLTIPAKVAAEGYNTLVLYGAQVYDRRGNGAGLVSLLENAKAHGIKVYMGLNSAYEPRLLPSMIEFVKKYKRHPSIAGWYFADEPELFSINGVYSYRQQPELIANMYKAIKKEDPTRPAVFATYGWTNQEGFRTARKLIPYTDVLWTDYYMVFNHKICGSDNEFACAYSFEGQQDELQKWNTLARQAGKPPIVPILQGSGEPQKRDPTAKEARYYIINALQIPTSGLLFWDWEYSTGEWRTKVLNPIVAELRPYLAYLKYPVNGIVSPDNRNLKYQVFRKKTPNTGFFLLVTNQSRFTKSANFRFNTERARTVPRRVTCDGSPVAVSANQFTLTLTKFDAKLCVF